MGLFYHFYPEDEGSSFHELLVPTATFHYEPELHFHKWGTQISPALLISLFPYRNDGPEANKL
jgi:hypothetical protein